MEEFDLKRFAKLAWAKKIFIILIMIASLSAGCFYSYMYVVPRYRSTTSFLLAKMADENSKDTNTTSEVADFSMTSTLIEPYISLLESKKVLQQVIDDLNLNMSYGTIKGMISVTQQNQAMIVLSVSSTDPKLASKVANGIADVFVKESEEIFNIANVNIIDRAEVATGPYNINHPKDITMFAMLGAFASCALVLLIYMLDTTIKEEEDIENDIGLPVLGSIPVFEKKLEKNAAKEEGRHGPTPSRKKDTEIVILDNAKSPVAESFRILRTNVTFTQNTKTILVTSSRMGEGKSYVTANLGATIAKTDKKVIIVDADMRKGRQNKIFNVDNKRGLSNYLANCEETKVDIGELTSYIKTTKIPNLHLITSGSRPSNPAELLSPPKIKGLLSVLSEIYDIILIDGTPSSIIADSVVISRFVDFSMLVTAYKTSRTEEIKKLIKSFEQVGVRLNGAVLNKYPLTKEEYTTSYYYSESKESSRLDDVERTEIRSVEDFLADAHINTNSFRYVDMDDSIMAQNPNTPSKLELAFKGTNLSGGKTDIFSPTANLEYKVEKIDSELSVMKNMLMQIAVTSNQVSAKDIELIRFDISNLKQSLDDIKKDEQLDEIQDQINEIKGFTADLVKAQANNNEKIKKFIEDYYKQKEELTKKVATKTAAAKTTATKTATKSKTIKSAKVEAEEE